MRQCTFLILALLLAACGGVDAPDELPERYTVATGDRVGLALPPDWETVTVTAEDFAATAEHLRETNPGLADRMDVMAEEIQHDTLRFWAYHPEQPITVNISAESVPIFEQLDSHAAANRRGLESFGYEIVSHEETTLNGQDAIVTEAEIQVATESGTIDWSLIQYTLISGNTAYSISFGAPDSLIGTWRDEFERIAGTFHTVD